MVKSHTEEEDEDAEVTRGLLAELNERHTELCHCHNVIGQSDRSQRRQSIRKLGVAVLLVFVFMFAEIIGGVLANSLAIATDAAHLLTDFTGFSINLVSLVVASRSPTRTLTFGWHRVEVLGALVSVLLLWAVTAVLVYLAVQRIVDDNYDIDVTVMLTMAVLGVIFNIIQSINLVGGGGHTHSDSHSDFPERRDTPAFQGTISDSAVYQPFPMLTTDKPDDTCMLRTDPATPVVTVKAGEWSSSISPHDPVVGSQQCVSAHVTTTEASHGHHPVVMTTETAIHAHGEGPGDHMIIDMTNRGTSSHEARHDWSTTVSETGHSSNGKSESINVRAALIHVLGDLAQSAGVLTAALVLYFKPEWKLADPICTFLFSIVVIVTTSSVVKEIALILLEGVPRGIDVQQIRQRLETLRGVRLVHDLHVWGLTSQQVCVSAHLVLDSEAVSMASAIVQEARHMLRLKCGAHRVTLQTEHYSDTMEHCHLCQRATNR